MSETDVITQETISLPNLYCYKCGHYWKSRSIKPPKTCPRCKSSRWDVPTKKEAECKFCHHTWILKDINEVCPSCGRNQTEGDTNSLHCNQCDHNWHPRKNIPPQRCPVCLSSSWNEPKLNRLHCYKCGHIWNNKNKKPIKCPNCQSREWNVPILKLQCRRCGYKWIPRGRKTSDEIKMCPSCKSKKWDETPQIFSCSKCGLKYTAKHSNSGSCPSCNSKRSYREYVCDFCKNTWQSTKDDPTCPRCGKVILEQLKTAEEIFDVWSDKKLSLRYVYSDGFACLYLWEKDIPVASMYIHDVCRFFECTVEEMTSNFSDSKSIKKWKSLAKEMYNHRMDYEEKIPYFTKRLNLSTFDATVLAIHFTGMGPEAISILFNVSLEDTRKAFDRIMDAYIDSGIIVDDEVFTENPFDFY